MTYTALLLARHGISVFATAPGIHIFQFRPAYVRTERYNTSLESP